jgi:hypothetical protein
LRHSDLIGVADEAREPSPARNLNLDLLSAYAGAGKADRKSDAGVQQDVIIAVVAEIAPKNVGLQPQFAEKRA